MFLICWRHGGCEGHCRLSASDVVCAGETNADALITKLEDALICIKKLTVQLRSKRDYKIRAPSCTPCRNGPTCLYLARGVCWFSHHDAERGAAGCTDIDVAKFIVDTESKLSSLSSKIQKDMSVLNDMGERVKVLEGKVSCKCAETDTRVSNMAKASEKNASDAEGKLNDLADAVINLELAMQESLSTDVKLLTETESSGPDILKNIGDNLESQWLSARLELEAQQDFKIDAKVKAASREVRVAMNKCITDATKEALRVAFECFPLPMQEDMENNLKEMTCAGYDQRKADQQEEENRVMQDLP